MTIKNPLFERVKAKLHSIHEKIVLNIPSRKICDYNRAMIMAMEINKSFQKYKGINYGKDVYIVGGGPTVSLFLPPESDKSVYIGINRAFKDERIQFDYLFAQDHLTEGFDDFINYRGQLCTKFLAVIPENIYFRIRDYEVRGEYERYVLASRRMEPLPYDISIEPVADLRGTVFSAIQFAVYTNPDHIYLVGFDCSQGNIYNKDDKYKYDYQLAGWKMLKQSLNNMGALSKIVVINPVGLKGTFNEVFTSN